MPWPPGGKIMTDASIRSRILAPTAVPVAVPTPEPVVDSRTTFGLWVRALRIHQWSKNGLLFLPMVLAQQHRFDEVYPVVLGFLFFSLIASATYIINDLSDLAADRAHPTKRYRPIASGRLSIPAVATVGVLLLVAGLAGAAWLMTPFLMVALAYLGLTLAYSFWLKREPMFDVFTIGVLFTIRLVGGMVLVHNSISLWLSAFAFTFFMSLAMAKRHSELAEAARNGDDPPRGRGYDCDDRELTRSFGVGSALIAFVIMVLYFQFRALATGLYDDIEILYLVPVVVLAWTLRVWLKAHRGLLRHDPVTFALKDRVSWAYGVVVAIIWLIAIPL
jgi:4-hydroxybenzoate polyprenyltransferase